MYNQVSDKTLHELGITQEQFDLIDDQLANNPDASDAELIEFFSQEGINSEVSKMAISLRDSFQVDPFAHLTVEDIDSIAGSPTLAKGNFKERNKLLSM